MRNFLIVSSSALFIKSRNARCAAVISGVVLFKEVAGVAMVVTVADTAVVLPELAVVADFDCFFEDVLAICTRLFLIPYSLFLVLSPCPK